MIGSLRELCTFNPTLFIPGTMHAFFNAKHWWGYINPEFSNAGLYATILESLDYGLTGRVMR